MVVRRWVMLGVVVYNIGATRFAIYQELFLEGPILDPIKLMSIPFYFFCLVVSLVKPSAV